MFDKKPVIAQARLQGKERLGKVVKVLSYASTDFLLVQQTLALYLRIYVFPVYDDFRRCSLVLLLIIT